MSDLERPFELPGRRFQVTEHWTASLAGAAHEMRFSYGFDADGRVRECFCGGFVVGSDLERHANTICIDISHALQYGSSIASLAAAYRKVDHHALHALTREIVQRGVSVERAFGAEAREQAARAAAIAKLPRKPVSP